MSTHPITEGGRPGPVADGIEEWQAKSYTHPAQVAYNGLIYITKENVINTDVPGTSDKWDIAGGGVTLFPEADLGDLTWNGGTPPSGTITKKYMAVKQRNLVYVHCFIKAEVAGSGNNQLHFDKPAELPDPMMLSNQGIGDLLLAGAGEFRGAAGNDVYGSVHMHIENDGHFTFNIEQDYTTVDIKECVLDFWYMV